jgi:CheY-like chemotaxis protein
MRPDSAASGAEALQILRAAAGTGKPYKLVLLDMRMLEMEGACLARTIKLDPDLAGTRLIFLASLRQALSATELQEATWLISPQPRNTKSMRTQLCSSIFSSI